MLSLHQQELLLRICECLTDGLIDLQSPCRITCSVALRML